MTYVSSGYLLLFLRSCAEDVGRLHDGALRHGRSELGTKLYAGEFNFVSHKSSVAQSGNQNQSLDDVANPL